VNGNTIENYELPNLHKASFSNIDNTDIRSTYQPIDYSDSDLASEEEVYIPRSRHAPKCYPKGKWTRSVVKMASVNKENMSTAETVVR
jgi:hypothetical protein